MVSEIEESATNASAYESDAWYNYTNDITEILDTRSGKMTNYSTLRIEEDNYRMTDSRLNAVLGTLFEYLGMNPAINKLLDSLKAQQLLDLVNSLLKENGADLSSGDIGNVVSQLLYGYNNGKGGETTGLALPVQYLFGNLSFTDKEVYKSSGRNVFTDGALSGDEVYVITYSNSDEYESDGVTPVLSATISREVYDAATMDQLPNNRADIVVGKKYTTGEAFVKLKSTTLTRLMRRNLKATTKPQHGCTC